MIICHREFIPPMTVSSPSNDTVGVPKRQQKINILNFSLFKVMVDNGPTPKVNTYYLNAIYDVMEYNFIHKFLAPTFHNLTHKLCSFLLGKRHIFHLIVLYLISCLYSL